MATCRDVIKNAYRKAGIIGVGQNVTAAQSAVALDQLQDLYISLVNDGVMGALTDVYTDVDYTPNEGERVYRATSGVTLTFPATLVDADTNLTRAPKDGALIVQVGPADTDAVYKVYDIYSASWLTLNSLSLTSQAPLTKSYKTDIEALLGIALTDEASLPPPPLLLQQAKLARYHLARRNNTASSTAQGTFF